MRIAIDTLGTRGDVQPYIALALGLTARGHTVQLAAPEQFATLAHNCAIPFVPLPGRFLDLLDTPQGKAAVAGSRGFGAGFKLLKHVRPLMRTLFDAEWEAIRSFEPDIIVYHPKALAAPHIADKLRRPAILASPLPGFTPTSDFPSPMLPFASLGPLNRISHRIVIGGANLLFGRLLGDWRSRTLGLARRPGPAATVATMYAYSPHVVPRPADWGRDVLVSGYWFLDGDGWTPDTVLASFLRAGAPPVYVGFGSMPALDPERLTAIVFEALERTGDRGLLATGGGAISGDAAASHVHVISGAPHEALFPLVDAVVHHGGAGTTAAAIRAGKPMAICPFFGDQPFWGRRAASLGIAPPTLQRKALTAGALAQAINAMKDVRMRQAAATLGEKVRAEDGVFAAVNFIEQAWSKV